MLKIGIAGASGRMGQEIINLIQTHPNDYQLGFSYRRTEPLPLQATVDVVIDFSDAAVSPTIAAWCYRERIPLVVGTTGLSHEFILQLQEYAKHLPILVSANMSLSVNVLFKVAAIVARSLRTAEVEIVESHHRYKKDAPSGTALQLGKEIAASRGLDFAQVAKFNRIGKYNPAREPDEIGFAVIRGGDIVGKHSVNFITSGEELVLHSEINNRRSFANGALYAAQFVVKQGAGYYSMADALGLSEL